MNWELFITGILVCGGSFLCGMFVGREQTLDRYVRKPVKKAEKPQVESYRPPSKAERDRGWQCHNCGSLHHYADGACAYCGTSCVWQTSSRVQDD